MTGAIPTSENLHPKFAESCTSEVRRPPTEQPGSSMGRDRFPRPLRGKPRARAPEIRIAIRSPSPSGEYGMPGPVDQDVYLAVLQLLEQRGGMPEDGELAFSLYEMRTVLGWSDDSGAPTARSGTRS